MKMYRYIVHDSILLWEELLKSIIKFPHLLIREIMKELSLNQAIFSTFSVEIHY